MSHVKHPPPLFISAVYVLVVFVIQEEQYLIIREYLTLKYSLLLKIRIALLAAAAAFSREEQGHPLGAAAGSPRGGP